jgi:membrane protein implicated in regulation of membrane protease activity
MTTTGVVLMALFAAFVVLAAVAVYRFYRRGGRTEDLIDEGKEAAKYTGLTPGGSG